MPEEQIGRRQSSPLDLQSGRSPGTVMRLDGQPRAEENAEAWDTEAGTVGAAKMTEKSESEG